MESVMIQGFRKEFSPNANYGKGFYIQHNNQQIKYKYCYPSDIEVLNDIFLEYAQETPSEVFINLINDPLNIYGTHHIHKSLKSIGIKLGSIICVNNIESLGKERIYFAESGK